VRDVCVAARKRGIPVVLDADEPRPDSIELLSIVSHVVFSAEGLRATAGTDSLGRGLVDISKQTKSFVAVTDGANDVLWLDDDELRQIPAYKVDVVDTLGAGDTFHGAFTLMLAEQVSVRPAMRFAAATAALKCTRYGGILGAPSRAEVEAFLQKNE
jgi:sulfofructose kinase